MTLSLQNVRPMYLRETYRTLILLNFLNLKNDCSVSAYMEFSDTIIQQSTDIPSLVYILFWNKKKKINF